MDPGDLPTDLAPEPRLQKSRVDHRTPSKRGVDHQVLTRRSASCLSRSKVASPRAPSHRADRKLRRAALLCLDGELALAEPKRMRQRLLHVAGRLVRSGRRVRLRLPRGWPWAEALVAAFARLRALPAATP